MFAGLERMGRTTTIVEAAVDRLIQGSNVILVGHSMEFSVKYLMPMARRTLESRGFKPVARTVRYLECASKVMLFTSTDELCRDQLGRGDWVVIRDHYVGE